MAAKSSKKYANKMKSRTDKEIELTQIEKYGQLDIAKRNVVQNVK